MISTIAHYQIELMVGLLGVKRVLFFFMDEPWLIKYPDNLKEKNLENVDESYGNNPVAEFIGSGVYAESR